MIKYLLALVLFFPLVLQAQTTVRLVDGKSGEPIPYVFGKINSQRGFVSDEQGKIEVTLTQPEEMVFTHVAFQTTTV